MSRDFSVLDEINAQYEQLAYQLLTTRHTRLAILHPDHAGRTPPVQSVIHDPRIRNHFASRCILVSCNGVQSAKVLVDRLAEELGVAQAGENTISAVLENIAAHEQTLVILDQLDNLYSLTNQEQQDATDVVLATLASIDELALIGTFSSPSLPECVAWVTLCHVVELEDLTLTAPEPEALHMSEQPHSVTTIHINENPAVAPGVVLVAVPDQSSASISYGATSTVALHPGDACSGREPFLDSTTPRTVFESRLPPARPKVFHGRDKECNRLVEQALRPNSAPLGIVGPGGIGKTTLALKVLHHPWVRAHFGKERLFLSCEGATSPDDVLRRLANKLGIKCFDDMQLWSEVIDNLRLRQIVFLVIDNFESIWSPTDDEQREASEVFLAQLAVLDELTLIVTTRGNQLPDNFAWANIATAELDTLSSTAARMTFHDLCCLKPELLSSDLEAGALTQLLREIDYMPLAITLLARLDDLPSRLLREWSEYHTEVLESDHHDGTRRELSVEVSIKISLAHLPLETEDLGPRQLLSACSQLPAGLFPSVASELRATIFNIDVAAQTLLRHSLVYRGGLKELRLLSPVRHYVSRCLPMSRETEAAMDLIYVKLAYARPENGREEVEGPAYDVEVPNILSILPGTVDRYRDICAPAVARFADYCTARKHTCLQLLQRIMPHLEEQNHSKAICLLAIADQHEQAGDPRLGLEPLEQAAAIFSRLGNNACGGVAQSSLASLFGDMGQVEDERRSWSMFDRLIRESKLAFLAHPAVGEDPVIVEQRYRDTRNERLGAGDHFAVKVLSKRIIKIVEDRGDEAAYTRELQLSLSICEQMQSSPTFVAVLYGLLSAQYLAQGRVDDAEEMLAEAFAYLSADKEPLSLGMIIGTLGFVRFYQNRMDECIGLLQTASRQCQEAGSLKHAANFGDIAEIVIKIENMLSTRGEACN